MQSSYIKVIVHALSDRQELNLAPGTKVSEVRSNLGLGAEYECFVRGSEREAACGTATIRSLAGGGTLELEFLPKRSAKA